MIAQFALPVLASLSVLGLALWYVRLFKINFEIAIFFTVAFITCILYWASLYEMLDLVAQLSIYISLGLFFLFIGLMLSQKDKDSLIKCELSSILLYVALIALLWIRLSTQKFILWDDFSHWGLASKDLYFTDSLPLLGGVVRFLDYPPAGSLFNYFVLSISDTIGLQQQKTFSEGAALFAQSIVVVSALFPVIGYALRKKGFLFCLVVLGVLFFSIFAFGYTPATLMIDLVVAVYFGGAVAVYIISGRRLLSAILLIPALICLVLLKSVGLFLSSVVVLIIVLDQIYILYSLYRADSNRLVRWKKLVISLAVLACLPLVVTNANLSWKHHVSELGAQTTFKTKVIARDVKRALLGQSSEKEAKVKDAFTQQLMPLVIEYPPGATHIRLQNVALTFLLLTLMSILIFRQQAIDNRVRGAISLVILFVSFLIYTFGLLLLYLFSFGEYEAVRLASFDRYLGIYSLGWLIGLLVSMLLTHGQSIKVLLSILCVSLLMGGGGAMYFIQGSAYDVVPKFTNSMEILLEKAKVPRNSDTKIYFISQCDTGFDQVIFKNIAYPAQISQAPYSIGLPCGPDDVWTANISLSEWKKQILSEYDYVIVAKANPLFIERFGSLFESLPYEMPAIYRVDQKSERLVNALSN